MHLPTRCRGGWRSCSRRPSRPSRMSSTGARCRRSRPRSAACSSACACSRSPRSCCSCSARSRVLPPAGSRDAIVPILVDVSRSMRLADADGQTRLARADGLLKNELGLPLTSHFTTELYGVGDGLAPAKRRRPRGRRAPHRSGRRARGRARALPRPARRRHRRALGRRQTRGRAGPDGQDGRDGQATLAGRRCSPSASARPTARAIAKCSASRPAIRGSIRRPSICT